MGPCCSSVMTTGSGRWSGGSVTVLATYNAGAEEVRHGALQDVRFRGLGIVDGPDRSLNL